MLGIVNVVKLVLGLFGVLILIGLRCLVKVWVIFLVCFGV